MFCPKWPGATHDHIAWESTRLKRMLEDLHALPEPYYFIGDEAFVNTNKFLIPWSGTGLGIWPDSFNYHLSAMRQCIERAFGLLTQRWGVFWRPLRVALSRWKCVASCAAKLHNYCIDNNIPCPRQSIRKDYQPGDRWVIRDNNILRGEDDGGRSLIRPHGDRRRFFTKQLEDIGKRRPAHAECNSKA